VDYCSIPNICSKGTTRCLATTHLKCHGGSVNQCIANPTLCLDQASYCVEMDDTEEVVWKNKLEKIGEGFACIKKTTFDKFSNNAPFCNFNKTNHVVLPGKGFVKPGSNLDYCCYRYLICVSKGDNLGGYLFKERPCYCTAGMRKCLKDLETDYSLWEDARELLAVVDEVKICTFDDSGRCNPLTPVLCQKGDLISKVTAHCKVNCATGPLLPIEKRSCLLRKCIPPNNRYDWRVIDVTNYRESSRCEPVKNLPLDCGMKHTRCVCDGMPDDKKSDGCRCQFWPEY